MSPYPPYGRSYLKFLGGGVSDSKIFKAKYEGKREFPGRVGDPPQKRHKFPLGEWGGGCTFPGTTHLNQFQLFIHTPFKCHKRTRDVAQENLELTN